MIADSRQAEAMFDRLSALLATLHPARAAVPKPAFGWAALCSRIPG